MHVLKFTFRQAKHTYSMCTFKHHVCKCHAKVRTLSFHAQVSNISGGIFFYMVADLLCRLAFVVLLQMQVGKQYKS